MGLRIVLALFILCSIHVDFARTECAVGEVFEEVHREDDSQSNGMIDADLKQIGIEAKAEADREIAAVLYPLAWESKRGGFHQTFSQDWKRIADTNTSVVAQARHVWTCAAYSQFSKDRKEEFQRYALQGLEFLDRAFYDPEHGGYYWAVGADGIPDASIGLQKHTYGVAFVLYAASEVYLATSDPLAIKVGQRAFDWLEKHALDVEHGGYIDSLDRFGKPHEASAEQAWQRIDVLGTQYGFKSMNSHIHLLEAFTLWHRVQPTAIHRQRLEETLLVVRDRIAVEPGVLCLYFTRDWRATAAHDSFGHDIETAYLMIEAMEELGWHDDAKTLHVAKLLVDHALDWGFDHDRGGFFDKGDAFGTAYDTDKVWWVQAEGLNALAVMHVRFGKDSERYRKALELNWKFVREHSIDQERGGWYWAVDHEGQQPLPKRRNQCLEGGLPHRQSHDEH